MFESSDWDSRESARGRPPRQNLALLRSPILWYRIGHYGGSGKRFRVREVKPSMHDEDEANRVYVTSGHTLVIAKALPGKFLSLVSYLPPSLNLCIPVLM